MRWHVWRADPSVIILRLLNTQRRKSVYNFGGDRNWENWSQCKRRRREAAIAEGKKPFSTRGSGGAPEADAILNILCKNGVHFMPKWSSFEDFANLIFLAIK